MCAGPACCHANIIDCTLVTPSLEAEERVTRVTGDGEREKGRTSTRRPNQRHETHRMRTQGNGKKIKVRLQRLLHSSRLSTIDSLDQRTRQESCNRCSAMASAGEEDRQPDAPSSRVISWSCSLCVPRHKKAGKNTHRPTKRRG